MMFYLIVIRSHDRKDAINYYYYYYRWQCSTAGKVTVGLALHWPYVTHEVCGMST